MNNSQLIVLLVVIAVIYKLVKWQEEVDSDKKWSNQPPSPPPYRPPWNQLHFDFNHSYYVEEWEQAGYDYNSARKWIDLGINPNELYLVQWIKEVKGLSPNYIQNKGKLADLRLEYEMRNAPKNGSRHYYY